MGGFAARHRADADQMATKAESTCTGSYGMSEEKKPCPRCGKTAWKGAGETHLRYVNNPERGVQSHRFWQCGHCFKIISVRLVDFNKSEEQQVPPATR